MMNRLHAYRRPLILVASGAGTTGVLGYAYTKIRIPEHEFKSMNGKTGYLKVVPKDAMQITQAWGPFGVGDVRTQTALILPDDELEAKLTRDLSSVKVKRKGNMVVRWDTACLPLNKPNEDRMAVDIIPRDRLSHLAGSKSFWSDWGDVRKLIYDGKGDEAKEGDGGGDLMMFSMLDGHGRHYDVSDLVKKVLHPTLAFALGTQGKWLDKSFDHPDFVLSGLAWSKTISEAYRALDNDINRIPGTILRNYLGDPEKSPLLPFPAPSLVHLANLEHRGSCATNMIVDIATDKMYVSTLGDTRAVAGWWNPTTNQWRCDVLSNTGDLNAQNPTEADHIRSLHPSEEHDIAIRDTGDDPRVLGSCAITRVFGGSRHKLPPNRIHELDDVFGVPYKVREIPYLTPPYLLNTPEIVVRHLHPASNEQLKFVVLATDGLWARMSSEEASLLITAHLADPATRPKILTKAQLAQAHPFVPPQEPRPWPAEELPGTKDGDEKDTWTFGDENAALHLIRNSLGPGNTEERKWRLSGDSRMYRDDASAMVVFFDEDDFPPTFSEIL